MGGAIYQAFPMAGVAAGQVWRYSPAYRRPRHFHAEPELNFVAAGCAAFAVGEGEVTARAGDLVWWLPGQDHELTRASEDLDMFVVGLRPGFSARVLGTNTATAHCAPVLTRVPPRAAVQLMARCTGLLDLADLPAVEDRVGDLWRDAHALRLSSGDMHPLTRRAMRLLMRQRDVRRADVCSPGGDPSDVSRYFRQNVHLTFTAYRNRLRLLRFIEEVDRRPDSLLAAALASGFGSYSQCHRSFLRVLGCAPRDFFAGPAREAMGHAFAPLLTL